MPLPPVAENQSVMPKIAELAGKNMLTIFVPFAHEDILTSSEFYSCVYYFKLLIGRRCMYLSTSFRQY